MQDTVSTREGDARPQALVIAPHHDDEAIGCGGLVAKLAARGWRVAITVVFAPIEGLGATEHRVRLREAEEAAAVLGAQRIGDLDLPCRDQVAVELVTWRLVEILRRVRPCLVLTPHAADRDPEHVTTHRACVEALWLSTSRFRADLGSPAPAIDMALGYEVWAPMACPQLTVDIGPLLETKLSAIRAYASQLDVMDYSSAARGLAAYRGVMYGGCEFAESYSIIEARENALPLTTLR